MVIFKRKTIPKTKFPPGVFVHVHEKGWMDQHGLKMWIDNVWNKRPGSLREERSLLLWDMFRSHVTEDIKKRLQGSNIEMSVIQGCPPISHLHTMFVSRAVSGWLMEKRAL